MTTSNNIFRVPSNELVEPLGLAEPGLKSTGLKGREKKTFLCKTEHSKRKPSQKSQAKAKDSQEQSKPKQFGHVSHFLAFSPIFPLSETCSERYKTELSLLKRSYRTVQPKP